MVGGDRGYRCVASEPGSCEAEMTSTSVTEYPSRYTVTEYPSRYTVTEYPSRYTVTEYPSRYTVTEYPSRYTVTGVDDIQTSMMISKSI